jgi:mono/diheme cytochrome c family protein
MPSMTRGAKAALHTAAAAAVVALALTWQCGEAPAAAEFPFSEAARRGQKVFRLVCASCHNALDPHSDGLTGPAVARSSRELLQAKVLRGEYPPGYTPKRPGSAQMPAQPTLVERIDDLYAFLHEVPAAHEPAR